MAPDAPAAAVPRPEGGNSADSASTASTPAGPCSETGLPGHTVCRPRAPVSMAWCALSSPVPPRSKARPSLPGRGAHAPDQSSVPDNPGGHPRSPVPRSGLAGGAGGTSPIPAFMSGRRRHPSLVAHGSPSTAVQENVGQRQAHPVPGENADRPQQVPEAQGCRDDHPELVKKSPDGPGAERRVPDPAQCHAANSEAVAFLPVSTDGGARTGAGAHLPGRCAPVSVKKKADKREGREAHGEGRASHPGCFPGQLPKKQVPEDEKCCCSSTEVDTLELGVQEPCQEVQPNER